MPEHPSALSGTLRRPFTEQIAFFRGKLGRLVPTARWDDISTIAHDRMFMVAGAAKADLLADLGAAVDRFVTEGKSIQAFRKDFRSIVERRGWHGWTGEGTAAGRAWRTRVIYQTNAATSYAAGREAQLQEFPIWIYRHGGSAEPRPIHLSWDGLTLPADHEFWVTHSPPNDWGCSCFKVGARSEQAARRLGGKPNLKLPRSWDAVDAKTGAPVGIGKGWSYAPGASVTDTVAAMAAKLGNWDYQLAKGFMTGVPEHVRDDLTRAYRALPSVADDVRRYAARIIDQSTGVDIPPIKTLGLALSDDVAAIAAAKRLDVDGYDFSVDVAGVRHAHNRHGPGGAGLTRQQRPITAADFGSLPEVLSLLEEIITVPDSAAGRPQVQINATIGGQRYITWWEVRRGRRTLALQTLWVELIGRQP